MKNKLTIMIVDDAKVIRNVFSMFLQEEFNIITAEDGYDAIARIITEKPDMLFLDLDMPRVDGYKTCEVIRNHPSFRNLPIFILSSNDNIVNKSKCKVLGTNEYLIKPFTQEVLRNTVKKYFDHVKLD